MFYILYKTPQNFKFDTYTGNYWYFRGNAVTLTGQTVRQKQMKTRLRIDVFFTTLRDSSLMIVLSVDIGWMGEAAQLH